MKKGFIKTDKRVRKPKTGIRVSPEVIASRFIFVFTHNFFLFFFSLLHTGIAVVYHFRVASFTEEASAIIVLITN